MSTPDQHHCGCFLFHILVLRRHQEIPGDPTSCPSCHFSFDETQGFAPGDADGVTRELCVFFE
jgi:hypothetical protein